MLVSSQTAASPYRPLIEQSGAFPFEVCKQLNDPDVSVYHLNPFLHLGSPKRNEGFGPFIQSGCATVGFQQTPPSVIKKLNEGIGFTDMKTRLVENGFTRLDAGQIAMWLTQVEVGSVLVMRHIYKGCQRTPAPLMAQGKYIGPVFVLGVVTERLEPQSSEDQWLSKRVVDQGGRKRDKFFRVSWQKMGLIDELNSSTRRFINVDQGTIRGTLSNITSKPDARNHRAELARKATRAIAPAARWVPFHNA